MAQETLQPVPYPSRSDVKYFGGEVEKSFNALKSTIDLCEQNVAAALASAELQTISEDHPANALISPRSVIRCKDIGLSKCNTQLLALRKLREGMKRFSQAQSEHAVIYACTGGDVLDFSARTALETIVSLYQLSQMNKELGVLLGKEEGKNFRQHCSAAVQSILALPGLEIGLERDALLKAENVRKKLFAPEVMRYAKEPLAPHMQEKLREVINQAHEVLQILSKRPARDTLSGEVLERVRRITEGNIIPQGPRDAKTLLMGKQYETCPIMGNLRQLKFLEHYDQLFETSDIPCATDISRHGMQELNSWGMPGYNALQHFYTRQDALRSAAPEMAKRVALERASLTSTSIPTIPDWVLENVAEKAGELFNRTQEAHYTPDLSSAETGEILRTLATLAVASGTRQAINLETKEIAGLAKLMETPCPLPNGFVIEAQRTGFMDALGHVFSFVNENNAQEDYRLIANRFSEVLSKPRQENDPRRDRVSLFGAELTRIFGPSQQEPGRVRH